MCSVHSAYNYIVSSATNKSHNARAHCTCALRVVLAEGCLHIIPEFLLIILALFSNSQMYLLCSKLCQHNVSMPAGRFVNIRIRYVHIQCLNMSIEI